MSMLYLSVCGVASSGVGSGKRLEQPRRLVSQAGTREAQRKHVQR